MSTKLILVLCTQALFIQTAFSSCYGRGSCGAPAACGIAAPAIAPGCAGNWGNNGLTGNSLAALEIIPTSGGGLPVSSLSDIAPNGLSVASENAIEGTLSVSGELPFLSAVAFEGVLPTAGAGAVSYGCGNGVTAIESIAPSAATYGAAGASGLGSARFGYGGRGCGCCV